MAKAVLALNLSQMTGWAYRLHDTVISGRWDLRPGTFDGDEERLARFSFLLSELHKAQPIESLFFVGKLARQPADVVRAYGGLMETLAWWCEGNDVSFEGVPIGEIRKFAAGRGTTTELDMVLKAKHWGYRPIGDAEAGALCLLHLKTGVPGASATKQAQISHDEARANRRDPPPKKIDVVENGVYVVEAPVSDDPKDGVWRMKAMHVGGYWFTVRDRDNPNGPIKVSEARYKIVQHIRTSLLTLEHFQGLSKDRKITAGSLIKPRTKPYQGRDAGLAPCHRMQVTLLRHRLRSKYFIDEAIARNGGVELKPWTPPPRRERRKD